VYTGIRELTPTAQPTFPRASAFAHACFALMDEQGLVLAERLQLKDLPKLAPYLAILGVLDEGKDFVIRLTGTRLVSEFLGADPTGLMLSQALPDDDYGKRSWRIVTQAFTTKRPVLNQPGRTRFREKSYLRLETVTVPLVDGAGQVTKLASLYDFMIEQTEAEALPPLATLAES